MIADGRVWHSIKSAWSLALEMHLATSWGDTVMTNNDRTPNTSKVARIGLSAGSTSVTWPSDCHSVHDPDQRRLLEKTCTHGEYKYTADDYWTTRIDNHKITLLPLHCQYWYDQRNLTSYCNITWEFYFAKNKNSLAPRWHDKFLPEPYIDIFKNLTHVLLVLHWALSIFLRPLWDSFHAFKVKITYTPYIFMLTSTLEVTQKFASHPHKNTPSLWHNSSCCKNNMGNAKEKQKKNIRAQKHGKKEKEKRKRKIARILK